MRAQTIRRPVGRPFHATNTPVILLALLMAAVVSRGPAFAEAETATTLHLKTQPTDPFGPIDTDNDPFETVLSDTPIDAAAYVPPRTRWDAKRSNFESPAIEPPQQPDSELPQPNNAVSAPTPKDPCAAAQFKPLTALGIGIAQPAGQLPTDFAAPCWNQINSGPSATCRCWPVFCYRWDATCLFYHPLYFEEVNAERYGYVCGNGCCCDCWMQPACSAAHFFGTIPALPYCMLAECPTDCVYTLGYYRPGDCVPWRWNYPPCDPAAAAGTAGIYTGLIFAIP